VLRSSDEQVRQFILASRRTPINNGVRSVSKKRSSQLSERAAVFGIAIGVGAWFLVPGLPNWVYIGLGVFTGAIVYQAALRLAADQTIVDELPRE
jgi:hypothetical protein